MLTDWPESVNFSTAVPFLLGGHQISVAPECPSMASTISRLKFGGLGVYCYRVTYVLPLCVTTLCIAMLSVLGFMKCASRLPLLSATAYCYVRTWYIDIV